MDDILKLPVCAWCQSEIPMVDRAIKYLLKSKRAQLSHGMCLKHLSGMYKQLGKELPTSTSNKPSCPNLHERPDLVKGYIELAKKYGQQDSLTERLQKLANIKP